MERRRFLSGLAFSAGAVLLRSEAFAASPVVAKFATAVPDGTPWSEQFKSFQSRIDERTKGRVQIKLFFGGALGDENTTVSECKRGAIPLWGGSLAAVASIVPELAVLELPYLFQSLDEADYVMDQVLLDDLKRLLEARGLVLVFWGENGFRSFGTTFGAVTHPDHLKGKKMRSQQSEVHLEMYRALGASPVPIAVTEVLSALQTGAVDGFDNTHLLTFATGWYKMIKHYSLAEAIYQPGVVVANKRWYASLSREDRKILLEDQAEQAARGRRAVRALNDLLLENLRKANVQVHRLTDSEKAEFARRCEPIHARWAASKGPRAIRLLEKVQAALAERRATRGG